MVGRLRPSSPCGAWMPALGNPLGRFHILRQIASIVKSIEAMALMIMPLSNAYASFWI